MITQFLCGKHLVKFALKNLIAENYKIVIKVLFGYYFWGWNRSDELEHDELERLFYGKQHAVLVTTA